MFGSMIDNSGITAFKTIDALRKLIPTWGCVKCGELHVEAKLECNHCSHKRPDPHNIIANRMLMDYEEKLNDYICNDFGAKPNPEIFDRFLMTIERHCKKHDIDFDMLRPSTRKGIEALPKEKRYNGKA